MYVYIFLFILISILYLSKSSSSNKGLYSFFAIIAILIAGFRDMIGGYDVYIYSYYYETTIGAVKALRDMDIGFNVYYNLLKLISIDRYFMFFVTSVLVLGLYLYYLKKLSVWLFFSAFIFFCKFYLMSFVYVRQGLAMVLVLMSLYYLVKNKKIVAIGFVTLAILLHKSSIIFLPFIFIANFKFSNFQIFFIILAIGILSFSSLGAALIVSAGEGIGEQKVVDYAAESGATNLFYLMEGTLILGLAFLFRKKFYQNKKNIIFFNGLLLYGLIMVFGINNPTFVRLSWYYFMFICLGLPMIYFYIRTNNIKSIFKNLVFIYYTLVFFRLMTVFDGGSFLPYKSIFQDFNRNGKWEHYEYRKR